MFVTSDDTQTSNNIPFGVTVFALTHLPEVQDK